jgi:hypothetical protein
LFGAVTGTYENRHPGEQAGRNTIVMDKMIVQMKDIRAIDSELPCDLQNGPGVGSSRFLKKADLYT